MVNSIRSKRSGIGGMGMDLLTTKRHASSGELASSASPASTLGGPEQPDSSVSSKRYDRQLRIWGAGGQARLESSRVALLNCGPTGTEALKNLVLGGIGAFTIVDAATVSAADLGNNWLVDTASLGEPRAKVVTSLLRELNDGVAGSYMEDSPEALLEREPTFFAAFDLVLATQMREPQLLALDAICRSAGAALLAVRSYGLVGTLRASLGEALVLDAKPDNSLDDLRLAHPWPELEAWAAGFDLGALDDVAHRHVPYPALLLQTVAAWKAEHGGRAPATSAERALFKQRVAGMRRRAAEGAVPLDEENLDEAMRSAYHVWTPPAVPPEVCALMEDEAATSPAPDADPLWVLLAALRGFVASEGCGALPLAGSLPDMTSTTDAYVHLARLYRERADRDVAALGMHVARILHDLGRGQEAVPPQQIRQFCKDARNVRVIRYRTLAQETSPESCRSTVLEQLLAHEARGGSGGADEAQLYVLLRAVDRFHGMHGRYPGVFDSELEDDLSKLKSLAGALLHELGAANAVISDDYVAEVCRSGAGELQVVAAVMGGIAAQEAIKLITRQFVPVAGTLVYNAISSSITTLEL